MTATYSGGGLQWRGWTLTGSAGVSPYTASGPERIHWTFTGSAAVAKNLGPDQSFSVSYARGIEPTYGLVTGFHLAESIGVGYSRNLLRNLAASAGASYSRIRDPQVSGPSGTGQTGSASLSYRITRHLSASIGGSVYSRTDPSAPRVSSYNMVTGISYGTTW
jgi:hypothetical protein